MSRPKLAEPREPVPYRTTATIQAKLLAIANKRGWARSQVLDRLIERAHQAYVDQGDLPPIPAPVASAADVAAAPAAAPPVRLFPIIGHPDLKVPFDLMVPHEAQARLNHCGCSLATIADAGGLSAAEAWAVVRGVSWWHAKTFPTWQSDEIAVRNLREWVANGGGLAAPDPVG